MLKKILNFLERLEQASIYYELSLGTYETLRVTIHVPGEIWEVDFYPNGEVYVEIFKSNGEIYGESRLEDLFRKFGD